MSVQLFAQLQGSTEYVNLSLFDAEPVKLSLSVTSIQDPLAVNHEITFSLEVHHAEKCVQNYYYYMVLHKYKMEKKYYYYYFAYIFIFFYFNK